MANFITSKIPNTLTCGNLVSGCIATYFALCGEAKLALMWIVAGAVFDFFDGMSARLLGVSSPIGKELDSLADDVTFGVAPSAMVFTQLSVMEYPSFMEPIAPYVPFFAFVMAAFSALRLAKFNLDTRQTTSFIGLPTPANALFWASLLVSQPDIIESSSVMVLPILAMICVSSNELRYSFIVFSAAMIIWLGIMQSFWVIITAYFLTSVIANTVNKTAKQ